VSGRAEYVLPRGAGRFVFALTDIGLTVSDETVTGCCPITIPAEAVPMLRNLLATQAVTCGCGMCGQGETCVGSNML
jgi:hypothetical protein